MGEPTGQSYRGGWHWPSAIAGGGGMAAGSWLGEGEWPKVAAFLVIAIVGVVWGAVRNG